MPSDRSTKYETRGTNRNSKLVTRGSRILGIDPGYGRLGIAIIESNRNSRNLPRHNTPQLIHSECFETESSFSHPARLGLVSGKIREVIEEFKPTRLAIETLIFSKNVKTALKVAEVRGIIIAEAIKKGVEVFEYHPNSVKIAITGYGKSDKRQIIYMIDKIVKPEKKIKHDDEYDAIAIALTCEASQSINNQIKI